MDLWAAKEKLVHMRKYQARRVTSALINMTHENREREKNGQLLSINA